ncbi:MAG: flagellar filament capping protein FliD [Proteobacteria bacterium]|nr:flagellar filament capping protein FliD [Pseudomonadota bacterium]
MALGTITSLGVGSNLELQDILDNLRKVDENTLNLKKTDKSKLEEQVVEFDSLNAKVLNMKSSALSLSLESNFLDKSASASDEDIVTASVQSSASDSGYSIEITQLATKSSWQSVGVESAESLVYAYPSTGIASQSETVITENTSFAFTIGHGDSQKSIQLTLLKNSDLEAVADDINNAAGNQTDDGSTYVTASVEEKDGGYYIHLKSTEENTAKNNQILISEGPTSFISPDITFSYQVGATGGTTYIAVPPGTTYAAIASIINDDPSNTGIDASVIDDGSGENSYHLTLTAKETGEDNRIYLNGLTMEEVQGKDTSLNSKFSINGVAYQRQKNDTIEDVSQGLTLNLKKEGKTTISISSSMESVKTEINDMISAYNEIIQEIKTKSDYDEESEEGGVFYNVSSVKTLGYNLTRLLSANVNTGGSITSLYDLGMKIDRDGTITIDEDVFTAAFASNPEAIKDLFIGNKDKGIEGLGDSLNNSLRSMTDSTGKLALEIDSAEAKITRLTETIEITTERLDKKYELLARQFVQLDAYIGKMNAQSQYLDSIIESFNATMNNNK